MFVLLKEGQEITDRPVALHVLQLFSVPNSLISCRLSLNDFVYALHNKYSFDREWSVPHRQARFKKNIFNLKFVDAF